MPQASITASDTFRLRLLRGERDRALLLAGIYAVLILTTLARRLAGGTMMHSDGLFFGTVAIATLGMVFEGAMWVGFGRACREGRLVARWRLGLSVAMGVAVPCGLMVAAHYLSPMGEYSALSAPVLLMLPLATILAVLRLRPAITLGTGLAGAVVHVLLVADTVRTEHVDLHLLPMLLMYGLGLAVIATAGWMVTRAARAYVGEAVAEAQSREATSARLASIERDLEVARQIQRGLLPESSPDLAGFDMAGMNRPAEHTGGDYYDWQTLPDGRMAVVMADVTGHGIGPALVMAVCRAYARASAPLDSNPASLLTRLNGLLSADVKGARFVTFALAMIGRDGRVELVSAGHGPTFLYRAATGKVEQFGGDGLPLAVMAEEVYGPSRSFTMDEGDVLVMLTDGLVEWQNAQGEQFGSERMASEVARQASRPGHEFLEAIDRAVQAFAGGTRQNDDVTAVVIRRTRA